MINNSEGVSLANLGDKESFTTMNEFWKGMRIYETKFVESSHMNLSWFGKLEGMDVVCQVGPEVPKVLQEKGWNLNVTNYFSPSKYADAKIVCSVAKSVGVPCPQILLTGVFESKSWCVVEKAEGIGLDTLWGKIDLKKQKSILKNLGGHLAKLHSLGINKQKPNVWYKHKLEGVFENLLKAEIYSNEYLESIKSVLDGNLKQYIPPLLTLTHNDILQKNILVEAETLEIKSIIDWETGGIGDPNSDLLLGAWWISGEYGGSEELYKAMLDGYNNNLTNKKLCLSLEKAKQVNPYMDMLWYLNILWIRKVMGDDSQTKRRKSMVEKILKELK